MTRIEKSIRAGGLIHHSHLVIGAKVKPNDLPLNGTEKGHSRCFRLHVLKLTYKEVFLKFKNV